MGHGDGVLGRRGGWLVPVLHRGRIWATVMVFWVGEVVGWYPFCIGGVYGPRCDLPTNLPTDMANARVACLRLKMSIYV